MGLYEDLLQNYHAKLIAGGAAQNTARGAQVGFIVQFVLTKLTITVHPPTKLGRLHWLCRKGQVRRYPHRNLQESRSTHRISPRCYRRNWSLWCCYHRPQPIHVHRLGRREQLQIGTLEVS